MCKDCGCEQALAADHDHQHSHEHSHDHGDGHEHTHHHGDGVMHTHFHKHAHGESRTVSLERKVLAKNDEAADRNREELKRRRIFTLNIISSPGSGKTTLLERTLERLNGKIACAVITGDQQTDNDARRLAGKGAPVAQIETGNSCHLNAGRVSESFKEVLDERTRILFIENVGNLICPAAFDLGEDKKVALLSVAEGEDKPLKYPVIFSRAEVVLLTKMDLAPHLDWDKDKCLDAIRHVCPNARIIELSSKTGQGMDEWVGYLQGCLK